MKIKEKLRTIDQLKAKIDSYGKLSPEIFKKINYKFRLDWNYYSNNMEGNTLTKDETRSIMIGNITIHGKPIRDVLEMRGHDAAITEILKIGKGELNISEKRIKDLHRAIMHEETEENKGKIGAWKTVENYILNYKDERFDFVKPEDVAEEMHKLINWLSAEGEKQGKQDELHPAILAIEFHLRYLTIHPFYDGNGRTARILMNLILISKGYPPIIIKTTDKERYYQYLADIQGYQGSRDFYYDLMIDLQIRSLKLVEAAIAGEEIEEPDDIDKRINVLLGKLEQKDLPIEQQSAGSLSKVLRKDIFPLLQLLESKINKIKPLFLSVDRRFQYMERGIMHELGSSESPWENIITNWLNPRDPSSSQFNAELNPMGISQFNCSYQFKGYKKSLSLQYHNLSISISFFELDFVLRLNDDYNSEKRIGYGQELSEKEIQDIVRKEIDKILSRMASASGIED